MDEREQFKSFVSSVLDLHRDNFIELLRNPEFQNNDIQRKETAVHYVNELFKEEIRIAVDSFVNQTLTHKD
jgi:hypothetical protein